MNVQLDGTTRGRVDKGLRVSRRKYGMFQICITLHETVFQTEMKLLLTARIRYEPIATP